MSTTYIIIEGETVMDGQRYSHAEVLRAAAHADANADIFAFDLTEALGGGTTIRCVTEDIIREAFEAGLIDREQAAKFIPVPVSFMEHLGNRADDAWHSGERA